MNPSTLSPESPCICTGSRRVNRNFWLDIATAVVFAALVGNGILLKWIVPPGIRGGRGLTWLGESRHFWGDVHFWLAAVFLGLVGLHLALHWSWIRACWKRNLGIWRSVRTWAVIVPVAVLLALPLVVPASGRDGSHEFRQHRGQGYRGHVSQGDGPKAAGERGHRGRRYRDLR